MILKSYVVNLLFNVDENFIVIIVIDILILKIEVKIDKFEYYALFVFYKLDC